VDGWGFTISGQTASTIAQPASPYRNTRRLPLTLAAGFALVWFKPHDRIAQLGFAAAFLSALRSLATPVSFFQGAAPDLAYCLNQAVSFTFPAVLAVAFHFFHRFSAVPPRARVWRWIRNLLYGITAVVLIPQTVFFAASLRGLETLVALADRHFWLVEGNVIFIQAAWSLLSAVALLAVCAVLIRGYRRDASRDRRRRIRAFAFGSAAGLAPMLAVDLLDVFLAATGRTSITFTRFWSVLRWTSESCQVILPISLAYAILRHRLLDIRVVLRRSLQYILARRLLQIVLLLPFFGLIWPALRNPNASLLDLLRRGSSIVNLVLLALIAASLALRGRLNAWLERRFFQDDPGYEKILPRFLARIHSLDSVEEVSRLVCNELDSALHPSWVYVWQWRRELGRPTLVHSSARGALDAIAPSPSGILRILESLNGLRDVMAPGTPTLPVASLAEQQNVLVVPVTAGGALLLGEKKSEQPYTEVDRQLLESIAGAMSVVFENFLLKQRVDEGLRERNEVLGQLDPKTINLLRECPACGSCFDSVEERCPADGSALTLTSPIDRTIARRYRMDRRIGKGGMGIVYEAADLELTRKVAVKIMSGSLLGDRIAVRRFEREARILARLSHPNIVSIYDFGRLGGGGAYLVMELLNGFSWRSELKRLGSLRQERAAVWLNQLLGALEAAHREEIVHRDLKPENVIVTARADASELLKVLDFGVAKVERLQTRAAGALTETGVVVGTVSYMSPEQLRGEPVGHRSDLFSVGVMAVEAITGRIPARGADGAILQVALAEQLQGQASYRRAGLHQILTACLAEEPARRPANAQEMRERLAAALR
jgi:eukaryotic-like serine/threonine-protein kinase